MKIKTYNILRWIPIVNLFIPRPAISICGSQSIAMGLNKQVSDYVSRHPELQNIVLTEKMVHEILQKTGPIDPEIIKKNL